MKAKQLNAQLFKAVCLLCFGLLVTNANAQATCTNVTTTIAGIESTNANNLGNSSDAIHDGQVVADDGVIMNSVGTYLVLDLGLTLEAGSEITFNLWSNQSGTRKVKINEGTTSLPNAQEIGIGQNNSFVRTYTLTQSAQYIYIEMTARNKGRTEFVEATITISCVSSNNPAGTSGANNTPNTPLSSIFDTDITFTNQGSPSQKINWPNVYGSKLHFDENGLYGIGTQSSSQYFRSQNKFHFYVGGSHQNGDGNSGGGSTLMTLGKDDINDINSKTYLTLPGLSQFFGNDAIFTGTVILNKEPLIKDGILFKDDFTGNNVTANLNAGSFGTLNGSAYFRIPKYDLYGTNFRNGFSVYSHYGNFPILKLMQGVNGFNQTQDEYRNGGYKKNLLQANGTLDVNGYLHVGKKTHSNAAVYDMPDKIDGAIAHFDGRVYISENDEQYPAEANEKGLDTNHAYYSEYLLWIEKGLVTEHTAYLNVDAWFDHVFDEDYILNTPEQVSNFIKQNGHLPTIPSEEDILENGFEAVDMTGRLVKTVEEQMLHIINQEKHIKSQQNDIEALQESVFAQNKLIKELLNRLERLENTTKNPK